MPQTGYRASLVFGGVGVITDTTPPNPRAVGGSAASAGRVLARLGAADQLWTKVALAVALTRSKTATTVPFFGPPGKGTEEYGSRCTSQGLGPRLWLPQRLPYYWVPVPCGRSIGHRAVGSLRFSRSWDETPADVRFGSCKDLALPLARWWWRSAVGHAPAPFGIPLAHI